MQVGEIVPSQQRRDPLGGGGGGGVEGFTTIEALRWIVPQARPMAVSVTVSLPLRAPLYAIDTVPPAVPDEGLNELPRLEETLQLTAFAVVIVIVAELFC